MHIVMTANQNGQRAKYFANTNLGKLVAQLVRVSGLGLCHATCHKFELHPTSPTFVRTNHTMSSLSCSVLQAMHIGKWIQAEQGKYS